MNKPVFKKRPTIGVVDGLSIVLLSDKEARQFAMLFGKNGNSKTGRTIFTAGTNPGLKSNEIAIEADVVGSYVPSLFKHANTKLMNFGLMLYPVEPAGKPRNADYHTWYLVEAPIEHLPVGMAVNDPNQ
ncbi:hypothetical protein ACQKP8_09590 [Photobacterium alginatilyticum]|uniref:hypothetical protein n=1 Tax=Photobacterium alginatilyticum TaxID=1775171 RepID=UPI004067F0C9